MDANGNFGLNPGKLGMYSCVPLGLPKSSALVVALHGCQQTAKDFDRATGWSVLGREHGFAVLFPEQNCSNNPQNCFNWFVERHIRREGGEIASIRAMVEMMLSAHKLDPNRVFVTGLSAGGAMACALLAACPDLFAAGAIIAGLPYGAALGPFDAVGAMAFGVAHSPKELGNLVRNAAPGHTRWPKVSIWHGSHDDVVAPANAVALVRQWLDIHQIDESEAMQDEIDGQTRRFWCNGSGTVVVEHYAINGMAHGVPVDAKTHGLTGPLAPFIYDAGISSTVRIAKSWGLLRQQQPGDEDLPPQRGKAGFHLRKFWLTSARASR